MAKNSENFWSALITIFSRYLRMENDDHQMYDHQMVRLSSCFFSFSCELLSHTVFCQCSIPQTLMIPLDWCGKPKASPALKNWVHGVFLQFLSLGLQHWSTVYIYIYTYIILYYISYHVYILYIDIHNILYIHTHIYMYDQNFLSI